MANYCDYKVIVKGKKNACYAFFGSMSCLDGKWIVEENGTDDAYTVRFEGNCKWEVDAYCEPWTGSFPVVLPDDAEDAMAIAEENYWYKTVQERSKMFEVEVWCNSADVEDYNPVFGPNEIFEHYIKGQSVNAECPDVLRIKGDVVEDERDLIEAYFEPSDCNSLKIFSITYTNPILEGILKQYNYTSEKIQDTTNIDCLEEMIPNYVGVKNISDLTTTLISLYISFGNGAVGLESELKARKNEIAGGFLRMEGTSGESSCEEYVEDFGFELIVTHGYDFKLENGNYKATYRICYGGW